MGYSIASGSISARRAERRRWSSRSQGQREVLFTVSIEQRLYRVHDGFAAAHIFSPCFREFSDREGRRRRFANLYSSLAQALKP
jgi:hypothetical protein